MNDWTYKLLRYSRGEWGDADAAAIWAELRRSPELFARYRAIQRLGSSFEGHWAAFAPPLQLEGRWSVTLRGVLDGARQLGTVIAERAASLTSLASPQLVPAYRGVADPTASPAVREALEEAEAAVRSGNYGESLDSMQRAADSAPQVQQELRWTLDVDETKAEVILLPVENRLIVRVPSDLSGSWTVLAMTDEADDERVDPESPKAHPLEPVEGSGYRVAEVDLEDGSFRLLLQREDGPE